MSTQPLYIISVPFYHPFHTNKYTLITLTNPALSIIIQTLSNIRPSILKYTQLKQTQIHQKHPFNIQFFTLITLFFPCIHLIKMLEGIIIQLIIQYLQDLSLILDSLRYQFTIHPFIQLRRVYFLILHSYQHTCLCNTNNF